MHRTTRARLEELNHHLVCVLCGGYFIDATSIIECLHSFCKTCIVRYLETSKFCPICDVQVHKTRPLLNIRADKTLQNLVYKLVPGLFEDEMRRRRVFYADHPEDKQAISLEERGEAVMEKDVGDREENISLCLEMSTNGRCPEEKSVCYSTDYSKPADRRYLLCPSALTIAHLKKFIRQKFSLTERYKVDIFHTEEVLTDTFTLLDIVYIYTWRRRAPLRLFYTVYEKPLRKRKATSTATAFEKDVDDDAKKAKVEEMSGAADDAECSNTHTVQDDDILQEGNQQSAVSMVTCDRCDQFSDISDYEPIPILEDNEPCKDGESGNGETENFKDRNMSSGENNRAGIECNKAEIEKNIRCPNLEKEAFTVKQSNTKVQNISTLETVSPEKVSTPNKSMEPSLRTDGTSLAYATGNHGNRGQFPAESLTNDSTPQIPEIVLQSVNLVRRNVTAVANGYATTNHVRSMQKDHFPRVSYFPSKLSDKTPGGKGVIVNSTELTKSPKKYMCSKLQQIEDQVNNNNNNNTNKMVEVSSAPIPNGHGPTTYTVEVKSEPLDLSDPSSRKNCIKPVVVVGDSHP